MTEIQVVNRGNDLEFYDIGKLERYLDRYVPEGSDTSAVIDSITEYVRLVGDVSSVQIQEELYSIVEGRISAQESYWQNVAGAIKADLYRKEVYQNRGFVTGLKRMFELGKKNGQYTAFFHRYTDEELSELEAYINHERDYYVNHVGVHLAYDRYTTSIPVDLRAALELGDENVKKVETLQERYMAISMFLHQNEQTDRIRKVKEGYDIYSGVDIAVDATPATPTFMNSGRPNGNLSSCFVGMAGDSIDGLYKEADQFAKISKNAGGYGMYFGKVRSVGSSIRGKKGLSSGSVPFMKLFDVTAGAVDQQGKRAGAVTITQDIWHRDFSDFLKTPLNNTTLEKQMHKIFLAASIPDHFFRKLMNEEDWYQFDPKEVQDVMGFCLEDYYDESTEGGSFSLRYEACVQATKNGQLQLFNVKDPVDILGEINKTRIEKGHPFLFFRDTVNRDNANTGMIYCSNLCMEIAISMSLSEVTYKEVNVDGEDVVVSTMKPGNIPTCNLSSLNLSKVAKIQKAGGDWKAHLAKVIPVQYRMLSNVITLNDHSEMPQTKISSMRKREVGLGVMGLAHALAILQIAIDSEAAIEWMDEVHEEIAYLTVKASMEKAKETGDIAPAFAESRWATGEYIEYKFMPNSRNPERWVELNKDVMYYGMYSTVLEATAPTETISYIANTTAGTDPIYNKEYTLEKAGIKTNMVAPDIDGSNFFFYKDAFTINKSMFLKGTGTRQKWIDQSISTNLYYIKDDLDAFDLIQDYIDAWEAGVKTIYYHRSESLTAYEAACEACAG